MILEVMYVRSSPERLGTELQVEYEHSNTAPQKSPLNHSRRHGTDSFGRGLLDVLEERACPILHKAEQLLCLLAGGLEGRGHGTASITLLSRS